MSNMSRERGRNASSVGMMEGAFFVSRTDLLNWVNDLLDVNLTKVEQCASGAIYCQIVDACHPGTVKMAKVNWMARSDHEFIPNYKVLQAAFDRNTIEKHVDVDKLIRAKYQDNLEFLQWMKAMWKSEGAGVKDYDPVAARGGKPVPTWAVRSAAGTAGPKVVAPRAASKENSSTNRSRPTGDKFDPVVRSQPSPKASAQRMAPRLGSKSTAAATSSAEVEELRKTVQEQDDEIKELSESLGSIEDERNFYFRKLRNVEILCTTLEAEKNPALDVACLISKIQGMLYAENEEEEEEQLQTATAKAVEPAAPDNIEHASEDLGPVEIAATEQTPMVA